MPDKTDHDPDIIDTLCIGCDIPCHVNDVGLCDNCNAKLERDLIRSRDWSYTSLAFGVPQDNYEQLRQQIIRDYGAGYELISSPKQQPQKRKNKRTNSRNTQRKRAIAAQAIPDYTTEDVFQSAKDFIQAHNEDWVNFNRLSQHLHETFFKLKPKRMGKPNKKYKSLLKLLADYPEDFEIRADADKKGLYWIRYHT